MSNLKLPLSNEQLFLHEFVRIELEKKQICDIISNNSLEIDRRNGISNKLARKETNAKG